MGEAAGMTHVPVKLVPVEVFGAGICDNYPCPNCAAHRGYGLSDAVPAWSDCNRADGKIYRVDDTGPRADGDTVTVWVAVGDGGWFDKEWAGRDDDERVLAAAEVVVLRQVAADLEQASQTAVCDDPADASAEMREAAGRILKALG